MPFLSTLQVTRIDKIDPKQNAAWRLTAPLKYRSKVAGQTFTIPKGFLTDFASVPRLPLAYLLAGDTAHQAAVVHDWLYVTHTTDRATADRVFLEAMEEIGVPWWRRRLMYAAVRAFGGSGYDSHAKPAGAGDE